MPDAETLDRITIRYLVTARFPSKIAGQPIDLTAKVVLDAGVYSGIVDKQAIADLLHARGVHGSDLDVKDIELADLFARKIMEDPISNTNIVSAQIVDVILDEQIIANSLAE